MKNFKKLFLLLLFSLLLVGCGEKENNPDTPPATTDDPVTEKIEEIEEYLVNTVSTTIFDDIELPTTYQDSGIVINWYSSLPETIDSFGAVNSPTNKVVDVILSYEFTYEDEDVTNDIIVRVYPKTLDGVAQQFISQFQKVITRDHEIRTEFYDVYTITWESTNTDVFTNEGEYIKPNNDVDFQILYTVSIKDTELTKEYSQNLQCLGRTAAEKFDEAYQWLQLEAMSDLYLTSSLTLPSKFEKYDIDITWSSSDESVVDKNGKVTQYVFERYVTVFGRVAVEEFFEECKFECVVKALDTSTMTEQEIIANFISAIAVKEAKGIQFTSYGNINQSWGFLNFYENKQSTITQMLAPVGAGNRPGITMTPQLVVVHDTANNSGSARGNASYVQSGGEGTSWHYSVGNDGIYQSLPNTEVGYHANGSSNTLFELQNTGIKATALKPNVLVKDSKIYINDQATNFTLPNASEELASDGLFVEIINGYYYLPKMWYCSSHGFNAVLGGNASGIGIETCVDAKSDYATTCRILAKLVAELLIDYDLTLSRVVQHNTTSGKYCPRAIKDCNYWYNIKDMISLEKYAKENLSEYTFTWTSTSEIMDNTGKVASDLKGLSQVSYSVAVTNKGASVYNNSYTTTLL